MKTNIHNRWTLGALFFAAVGFSSIANAALVGRLSTTLGGTDYQAYYDTDANLTWLAHPGGTLMSWWTAKNYAANLTIGGISGWRLPTVANPAPIYGNFYQGANFGYNITTPSELSNMFYTVLGNTPMRTTSASGVWNACRFTAPYYCLTNTGPFTFPSLNSSTFWRVGGTFWSGTVDARDYSQAWDFGMLSGLQAYAGKNMPYHFAWAVHSGDVKPPAPPVSAVPVPASIWLFGSGLVGFIGLAKRKMRTLAA